MRKILLLIFLLLYQGSFIFALKDCDELGGQYEDVKNKVKTSMQTWEILSSDSQQKTSFAESLSELLAKGVKLEEDYNNCVNSLTNTTKFIESYFET